MSFYTTFRQKNPSLFHREFRWYLVVRFFLLVALFMQSTTVFYWIYDVTESKLQLGLIGLAEVIPAVGMSLLSGHIVDQSEKRKSLLLCLLAYFFMAVGVLIFTSSSVITSIGLQHSIYAVFGLIFIGGIIRSFISPSNFALMGLLLPKDEYANAASWSSMSWQLGGTIGPMLAGMVIGLSDVHLSFQIVVGILLIPLFAIFQISKKTIVKKVKKEPLMQSIQEGLSFVFKTPVILGALALDLFSVLLGGAMALLPVFQRDILKVSEFDFGLMRSAPGLGAIITISILAFLPLKKQAGKKLFLCVAGFGVSMIIFGLSKNFYLSLIMLVCSGMLDAVSVVIRGIILQLYTPEQMRGRVAAVNTMFISSSNELGDFESGLMAHWLGPIRAVVVGGMLTLGVVAFTFYKSPQLRKFEVE